MDSFERLVMSKRMVELGDLLVKIGHDQSYTNTDRALYYQEALKYYLLPLGMNDSFLRRIPAVDDRVLLLLAILGGEDQKAVSDWCMTSYTSKTMQYMQSEEYENDITFGMISLYGLLKLLVNYRKDWEGLGVYKETMQSAAMELGYTISMDHVFNQVSPYLMGNENNGKIQLEVLPGRIRRVIASIRKHWNGSYLIHFLMDTNSEDYASKLFPNRFGGTTAVPGALWMVFKDCFVKTPGLIETLREFFSEGE